LHLWPEGLRGLADELRDLRLHGMHHLGVDNNLKCAIHLENGNKVVGANQNKVPQCYQRDLKASGIKCSDNTLATYTTTGCCSK
jgi:hypothetical protein